MFGLPLLDSSVCLDLDEGSPFFSAGQLWGSELHGSRCPSLHILKEGAQLAQITFSPPALLQNEG